MKVKSQSEVAQSCPTLSDPMDCSLRGSSVLGIFQARVLEWGAIAFSNTHSTMYKIGKYKDVLYSTENYTQYLIVTRNGKESESLGYIAETNTIL